MRHSRQQPLDRLRHHTGPPFGTTPVRPSSPVSIARPTACARLQPGSRPRAYRAGSPHSGEIGGGGGGVLSLPELQAVSRSYGADMRPARPLDDLGMPKYWVRKLRRSGMVRWKVLLTAKTNTLYALVSLKVISKKY